MIRIRRGTAAEAEAIADRNVRMALETENMALDPATALAGTRAVLLGVRALGAKRGALPFFGRAVLELELDGVPVARVTISEDSGLEPISLPLRWKFLEDGEHRIDLRLAPESNTTVRIARVELRLE